MINSIKLTNFRAILDDTLPLQPLNLLVGPNGSGKTTALQAVRFLKNQGNPLDFMTIGAIPPKVEFNYSISLNGRRYRWFANWELGRSNQGGLISDDGRGAANPFEAQAYDKWRAGIRHYAFDSGKMRAAVPIKPHQELDENGANLAGFLDFLRDNGSSNFEALERTLSECLPEFDEIGFDRPSDGHKAIKLRRKGRNDYIPASLLSEGTLYVVALVAIVYQTIKPTVVCIEEPDRGIHPRLYRQIYDTLCRLAFPDIKRDGFQPIQVIATTHSPYFLNTFTDHPEHVVTCENDPVKGVTFRNLGSDPNAKDILKDSLIGDAWASGALSSFTTTVS